MTQGQAAREIRELLAGQPGGVNRVLRRFGKLVVDYATALIPDREPPFERLVEDILVDVISQSRASARARSDEAVFEFVIESAQRTVRARYRELLEGQARPDKATRSYSFKEIVERGKMSEAELTAAISEGRVRAIRANDQLKIKGESIPGLGDRRSYLAYHATAAQRELLCLHFRFGFSPETIARWSGVTPVQIEESIARAATQMAAGRASRAEGGDRRKDTEMRRYIDGRMAEDETAKFERGIIKDKIAQQRLDELRTQSDSIKEMFTTEPYDLSSIAVNVRSRNPHHALTLPPVAALWLQVVCIAALLMMFHNVGAYLPPPTVEVSAVEGEVELPEGGRLRVGEVVETGPHAQALLVIDESSRVLLAPGSSVTLLEPRPDARQVLGLSQGEIWGRFTSTGHAFLVEFPSSDDAVADMIGEDGAEFDLLVGPGARLALPDNLERERLRALGAAFEPAGGGLQTKDALWTTANFRFGGGSEEDGLHAGDIVESIGGVTVGSREDMIEALRALRVGDTLQLTVRRGDERTAVPLTRIDELPIAVLRVFQGAVTVSGRASQRTLVNRGQWALFTAGQPPLVGLRGVEDYRVLRIGPNDRFKNSLHWLKPESYPLRAENSLVAVDRALRELAARLEAMRADEIRRDGPRELVRFEVIIRELVEEARARLNRGEGREREGSAASLSDRALVDAEPELLGLIEHWRKRSGTGVYPTLGSAAKTLNADISRFRNELEDRGEELTRSIVLQERIKELDAIIALQDSKIAGLKESAFHDADGSARKAIDDRIAELARAVKAGSEAQARIDLLTIKLNDLDTRIDAQRRKLPNLRRGLNDAQAALDHADALLAANIYTPEKLAAAQARQQQAAKALAAAKSSLEAADADLAAAKLRLSEADKTLTDARKPLAGLRAEKESADDAFTDAVTSRATRQAESEAAEAEVARLQAELDALPEGDPLREGLQAELNLASAAADTAGAALEQARKEADDARIRLDSAGRKLSDAETDEQVKKLAQDVASTRLSEAQTARDTQATGLKTAESASTTAEAELTAQQDAKTARALLDTRRTEAESALAASQASLKEVEDTLAVLEAEAAPRRTELAAELAIVEAAGQAKLDIESSKTERGRYQAISDEIARRDTDRAVDADERSQLAGSNLVANFGQLKAEYETLSRRIDAFEFLRARGLLEDATFEHEQKAAQDRFREAATSARDQAVALLDGHCPAYDAKAYKRFTTDEGKALRLAILEALWKLYYDAGLDGGSDAVEQTCYYVIVQSGAGSVALDKLDNRWKTYLTAALGQDGFEAIKSLSAEKLLAGPDTRKD